MDAVAEILPYALAIGLFVVWLMLWAWLLQRTLGKPDGRMSTRRAIATLGSGWVLWALSWTLVATEPLDVARGVVQSMLEPDVWSGWVYPSRYNLLEYQAIGEFETEEECVAVAQYVIRTSGWTSPDYECGLNCQPMFPEVEDSIMLCE